jgi:hypothetical protein
LRETRETRELRETREVRNERIHYLFIFSSRDVIVGGSIEELELNKLSTQVQEELQKLKPLNLDEDDSLLKLTEILQVSSSPLVSSRLLPSPPFLPLSPFTFPSPSPSPLPLFCFTLTVTRHEKFKSNN